MLLLCDGRWPSKGVPPPTSGLPLLNVAQQVRLVAAVGVRGLVASLDLVLDADADHGGAKVLADLGEHLRVVVVGDGLDDGAGTLGGVTGED